MMKNFIKQKLHESITFDLLESMMVDEDYPSHFDMDHFKSLTSFNSRITYCNENLKRISSGSGRIVYIIDDTKVLKLAKNKKGVAQNEVEIEYSNYFEIKDIVARVIDYHMDDLWVEMELARNATKSNFKQITGFNFDDYCAAINNYYYDTNPRKGYKMDISQDLVNEMWENEFTYSFFQFIGDYGVPVGDLKRLNSYGVVNRNGEDTIVMIDYGLTHDVYDSYYS